MNLLNTDKFIHSLKNNGYVNLGQRLLSTEDISDLSSRCKTIYKTLSRDHADFMKAESGGGGVRGIIEHDKKIAEITNKIVSHPEVKKVLSSVLGPDYKIWQINFRNSLPGDPGLQLHQDGRGQVNLCVLLDDNSDGQGATSFFPQTHLYKQRTKELNVELEPKLFKAVRFLVKPFSGKMGDIGVFFNRTWHGRFPNHSSNEHAIFMMGFFPGNTEYGLSEPYKNWSKDFLVSIEGTELYRLLNPEMGTEKVRDHFYRVTTSQKEIPFAVSIENFKNNDHLKNNLSLIAKVALLKTAMSTGRPVKKMIRTLKGLSA